MTPLGALAQAYLEANVLLALALAAWLVVGTTLRLGGLPISRPAQLGLLRLSLLTAVLAPPLLLALRNALFVAGEAPPFSITPSDYLIAAYLAGRTGLTPADLATIAGAGQRLYSLPSQLNAVLLGTLPLFLAGGVLYQGFRLLRNLAAIRHVLGDAHTWHRSGRLHLVFSDRVAVPFATRSLRRRYVVLPSRLLGCPSDLRIATAHEIQHIRNGDVEWAFLLEGLKLLFFWNPAFVIWKAAAERLTELACDRRVVTRTRSTVADYCDCLLRASRHRTEAARQTRSPGPLRPLGATGLLPVGRPADSFLRRRVLALLDGTARPERRIVARCAAFCLVGLIGLTAVSIQPRAAPSALGLHLSTLVNLERLTQRKGERGYNLVMSY